jgi:hypothetical protein
MRFQIEQRFRAEPQAVVAALTDPDLYGTYEGLSKVAPPEVIDRSSDGDVVDLRLRMRFTADLPRAARAVIDPARLSWVQHEQYDLTSSTASVVFHPDDYQDRFSCSGGYRFETADAGSCRRTIAGELSVQMLLVGRQVESALVSGLRQHFAEEQPLVQRWLDR